MRQAVEGGSQLLTTITNDGWYGQSSAPYQHFALASMRAIEQGRYLARAANTGISGVVDPYGRVVRRSAIFEQVGLVEEVRLLTGRTIYSLIGDAVAYVAMALTAAALITVGRGDRIASGCGLRVSGSCLRVHSRDFTRCAIRQCVVPSIRSRQRKESAWQSNSKIS